MNSLSDYIVERIRIDNIKLEEFPVDGTYDEVVDFLERCGFNKIKDDSHYMFNNAKKFNQEHKLCFSCETSDSYSYVIFADTTKSNISDKNRLYCINFDPNKKYHISSYRFITGISGNVQSFHFDGNPQYRINFKYEMEKYFNSL